MKIVYTNARSIISKIDHLSILINDNNPDLVIITETWLNGDINNCLLNIPGYYIEPELRVDRSDTLNGIGGGILIYVRNNLIIKPVSLKNDFNMFIRFDVISYSNKDDGASSQSSKPNLTVTVVYRPPSARHSSTELLCKLF